MSFFLLLFSYALSIVILIALAYRDYNEYILPDILNLALALTFVAFHTFTNWDYVQPMEALYGALAGGGLLLGIKILADRFYKTDSLGLGDVKLMAAAGIGLGFPNIMLALTIGALFGLLHGILIARLQRKPLNELGSVNVPAGVGLCLGILTIMLYQFGFTWITQ